MLSHIGGADCLAELGNMGNKQLQSYPHTIYSMPETKKIGNPSKQFTHLSRIIKTSETKVFILFKKPL